MTKRGAQLTHAKHHSSRENTTNMDTKEVKQVRKFKLKYLSEKQNEYGTNHFYQVLDGNPLKELIELGKTISKKENYLGIQW